MSNKLTNKSETDHCHPISQADAGDADTVQSDAAKSCKTGVLECHFFWNTCNQIPACHNRFGMTGTFAAVRNTIAKFKILDRCMLFDNYASSRIAKRGEFAELRADLPNRRQRSIRFHHRKTLPM